MLQSRSRVLNFAAGAACSAIVALTVAPMLTGAVAQEQPLDTGGAADIAALTTKLADLERKVDRMDREQSTIRAPFTVVGADGRAILTVADEAGRARLTVGNVGGAHVIIGMTDQGSGMSFKDAGGETRAQIAAGTDVSQIYIEDQIAKTLLGSTTDGSQTGVLISKGETSLIELATDKSGGALKTFDVTGVPIVEISGAEETPLLLYGLDGKPFFSVGLPETSKQLLVLGDPAAARVELGLYTDRAGSFVSVIDKSGIQRATMTADREEFPISVADEQGKDIFSVGPLDKTGPVQMTIGDAAAAHVQLGLFAGESGSFVSALDKSGVQRATITADPQEFPISVFDEQSKEVFTVGPATEGAGGGPTRLMLGEEEGAHVRMGLFTGEAGSYLQLYDRDAKLRSAVTADATAMPLSLYDEQDQPIFTVGAVGPTAKPELVLGDPTAAHLQLGVLKTDTGSYVSLYDSGGEERAFVSAEPDKTKLSLSDREMRADLGTLEGGRKGLILGKEEKDFLTMRFDDLGGFVKVGNASGVGVAAIASQAEGGEFQAAGPEGGVKIASFGAGPGGSQLRLFDSAGKARATITATDAGDLGLYSATGWLNLNSGKNAPRFQIMDAADTIMVQAGVDTKKNVGVVQVGPGGNGAASSLGNIGKAASSIIGSSK